MKRTLGRRAPSVGSRNRGTDREEDATLESADVFLTCYIGVGLNGGICVALGHTILSV